MGTRPAVKITLRSTSNTVLYSQCHRWPELDHFDGYVVRPGKFVHVASYGNTATINGGFKLDAIAQIPANPALLATASRIDVDIVPGANCPNQ